MRKGGRYVWEKGQGLRVVKGEVKGGKKREGFEDGKRGRIKGRKRGCYGWEKREGLRVGEKGRGSWW